MAVESRGRAHRLRVATQIAFAALVLSLSTASCAEQAKVKSPDTTSAEASVSPAIDINTLVEAARAEGAGVALLGRKPSPIPWFPSPTSVLCFNGQKVTAWQYGSVAEREGDTAGISADGTYLGLGYADLNARMGFWASGRVLVFYPGTDQGVMDALTSVLGSTLTPDAVPRGPFGQAFDVEASRRNLSCQVPGSPSNP